MRLNVAQIEWIWQKKQKEISSSQTCSLLYLESHPVSLNAKRRPSRTPACHADFRMLIKGLVFYSHPHCHHLTPYPTSVRHTLAITGTVLPFSPLVGPGEQCNPPPRVVFTHHSLWYVNMTVGTWMWACVLFVCACVCDKEQKKYCWFISVHLKVCEYVCVYVCVCVCCDVGGSGCRVKVLPYSNRRLSECSVGAIHRGWHRRWPPVGNLGDQLY